MTYLLEAVAIIIGLAGVAASFASLAATRRKEFGMLRHLGVSRAQIGTMLALEGGLVAGIGCSAAAGRGRNRPDPDRRGQSPEFSLEHGPAFSVGRPAALCRHHESPLAALAAVLPGARPCARTPCWPCARIGEAHATPPLPHRPGRLAGLLPGPAAAVDFAPVLPGRRLVFSDDFGAHPDFRTEWWYATGWLKRQDGRPLGFRSLSSASAPASASATPAAFALRQLAPRPRRHRRPGIRSPAAQRTAARAGFGHAGYTIGRSEVWIGNWRFAQQENAQGQRYQTSVRGEDFLPTTCPGRRHPALLNGQRGFSSKAADPRHASFYYSRPQLAVSGSLSSNGRTEAVSGHAWLDHEWSSELLPDGAQGWDWVGINLADGGGLMAFRLRDASGNALWAAGFWRARKGRPDFSRRMVVHFLPLRHWRSPRTGIDYPVAWRLQVGERNLN